MCKFVLPCVWALPWRHDCLRRLDSCLGFLLGKVVCEFKVDHLIVGLHTVCERHRSIQYPGRGDRSCEDVEGSVRSDLSIVYMTCIAKISA